MCVVSMVHDHFDPIIPKPSEWWHPPIYPTIDPNPFAPNPFQTIMTPEQLAELLEMYKKALKAAKVVDTATGQPDCEDPKKAELLERVAALEAKLAQGPTKLNSTVALDDILKILKSLKPKARREVLKSLGLIYSKDLCSPSKTKKKPTKKTSAKKNRSTPSRAKV